MTDQPPKRSRKRSLWWSIGSWINPHASDEPLTSDIKGFLLNTLPSSGRKRIEKRIQQDYEFFTEVIAVEHDLLDGYLRGLLPSEEIGQVEKVYLSSPARARRLQIARALQHALLSEADFALETLAGDEEEDEDESEEEDASSSNADFPGSILAGGDVKSKEAALIASTSKELHQMAVKILEHACAKHNIISAETMVVETYARMLRVQQADWSRRRYLATAAILMRRSIVNQVRAHQAQRRGSAPIEALELPSSVTSLGGNLGELDATLNRLAETNPRRSLIFELRYFAGMAEQDISDALNLPVRTVRREWRLARVWLARHVTLETHLPKTEER